MAKRFNKFGNYGKNIAARGNSVVIQESIHKKKQVKKDSKTSKINELFRYVESNSSKLSPSNKKWYNDIRKTVGASHRCSEKQLDIIFGIAKQLGYGAAKDEAKAFATKMSNEKIKFLDLKSR